MFSCSNCDYKSNVKGNIQRHLNSKCKNGFLIVKDHNEITDKWIQALDKEQNEILNYEIVNPYIENDYIIRSKSKYGYKYGKGTKNPHGYIIVTINNTKNSYHIIVCSTFNGAKPGNNYSVDHIDRDTMNNHPDNLRWVLPSTQNLNKNNSHKNGQMREIICEYENGNVKVFNGVREAANKLNIRHGSITNVLTGRNKSTNGLKFRFKEIDKIQKINEIDEIWIDYTKLNEEHDYISNDIDVKLILDYVKQSKYLFSNYGRICENKNDIKVEVRLTPSKAGRRYIGMSGKLFLTSRILAVLFLPYQIKNYLDKGYNFNKLEVNHIKHSKEPGDKTIEYTWLLEVLSVDEHRKKDSTFNLLTY
jgi:hypothetical protein